MSRGVYLHTFGCQMNEHDTRRIAERLKTGGFREVAAAEDADLVVINTCSVREHAVQKALSELGRLKVHKQARGAKIAVTGCVAQQEGDALLRKYKDIDLVVGPDNIFQMPALVERAFAGQRLVRAELDESPGFEFLSTAEMPALGTQISAFITVQKGCDKNCSYCIVPRVRGREVSRPLAEITAEVAALARSGVREVTLLGQNIDAYRDPDGHRFDALLGAVAAVPDVWRVRFTTGHPNDFSEPMARAMAECMAICEHLHLPAQSGSDAILKRMYRGYTRARYLEKIAMVREKIPDLRLTSDLIVGFPGESEEDFEKTLELVSLAGFDAAFCFSYSVRPGTPAEPWAETVSEADKRRRLIALNAEVKRVAIARTERFIGRTMEVLVEGPSRTNPDVLCGRIRHNLVVNFAGQAPAGSLVPVEILSTSNGFSLWGEVRGAV